MQFQLIMKKEIVITIIRFIMATFLTILFYLGVSQYHKIKRRNNIVSQFQEIADIVHEYSKTHLGYRNLANSYFLQNTPQKNMVYHPHTHILENMLGGSFLVYPVPLSKNKNGEAYIIEYQGVGMEDCINLASYDWNKLKNATVQGMIFSNDQISPLLGYLYDGCEGALLLEKYAIGCNKGKVQGIPFTEFETRAVCRCNKNNCSLALKLH